MSTRTIKTVEAEESEALNIVLAFHHTEEALDAFFDSLDSNPNPDCCMEAEQELDFGGAR